MSKLDEFLTDSSRNVEVRMVRQTEVQFDNKYVAKANKAWVITVGIGYDADPDRAIEKAVEQALEAE